MTLISETSNNWRNFNFYLLSRKFVNIAKFRVAKHKKRVANCELRPVISDPEKLKKKIEKIEEENEKK